MFVVRETLTNKRKLKKIMQISTVKSPFVSYGSNVFNKKNIIMHLLQKKYKKAHFLNGFLTKHFKIVNGPIFN
jgi:hypothetical protein